MKAKQGHRNHYLGTAVTAVDDAGPERM